MVLRDLILGGGGACLPDGAPSAINPLGGLADSLLGSSSKSQETLRELPGITHPRGRFFGELSSDGPFLSLPGSEFKQQPDGWEEASSLHALPPSLATRFETDEQLRHFSEFEGIYNQETGHPGHPAPSHSVLSGFLHSFLDSSREQAPFPIVQLPRLGLSESDKRRIRDRSSIMARHFFADKGEDFVTAQVTALLQSLDIEDGARRHQPSELEDYWKEAQGGWSRLRQNGASTSNAWADSFSRQRGPEWADEFSAAQRDPWADEFVKDREAMVRVQNVAGPNRERQVLLGQSSSLVQTLSQNEDPKFKNSKFLQFVSKMSRGELIVEDNQVKEGIGSADGRWADEYHDQLGTQKDSWWAGEHVHPGDNWVDEFTYNRQGRAPDMQVDGSESFQSRSQDWVDDFSSQVAKGAFEPGGEDWLDTYDKFVEEQLNGTRDQGADSRFVYVFSDQNPYVGHANPLREGQDLFRRGLLSEAVLALEAEVLKNPENAEGWRLLGIAHAENDDDRQAIASMVQARNADPANLEVLLALGVSHTNELEQTEALQYLRGWLQNHPKYGQLVQAEGAQRLDHKEVAQLFSTAASMAPEDGDVHTVLGVLYNLSREYDKAIGAFQMALKLKPRDYSLWNKFGATQANSARSADAIFAYQQALDLKPNYVRAWSNMGIGFANQGQYEESIPYYVRALSMNPKADNVWQYLRMSLSCSGKTDLLGACDARDIAALQDKFQI